MYLTNTNPSECQFLFQRNIRERQVQEKIQLKISNKIYKHENNFSQIFSFTWSSLFRNSWSAFVKKKCANLKACAWDKFSNNLGLWFKAVLDVRMKYFQAYRQSRWQMSLLRVKRMCFWTAAWFLLSVLEEIAGIPSNGEVDSIILYDPI